MSNPKVSLILPIYNMSEYLHESLDSIVNQTFKDIEIICVDDGSTDNSLEIINEYAQKDSRIVVCHQKNQGVSASRNNGIQLAKGDYITFVDPDDYIREDAVEIIYNTIVKKDADILFFAAYKFAEHFCTRDVRVFYLAAKLQNECVKFEDYPKVFFNAPLTPWGKIFRTSLIKENNIKFPVGIKCGEDRLFGINAFINAKSICAIDEALYFYRSNAYNSLSKFPGRTIAHNFKVDLMIKKLIYSSDKIKDKNKIYKEFLYSSQNSILWQWRAVYNYGSRARVFKYIKLIAKEYKPFLKDKDLDRKKYKIIKDEIFQFRCLFFKKLFEPFFELEHRENRLVLYLFNRQVLNIYTGFISSDFLRLKYFLRALKLRFAAKMRKIKVAFLYYEPEKWSSVVNLYREFEASKHFEPVVYLTAPGEPFTHMTQQELLEKNLAFLDSQKVKYEMLYDNVDNEYSHIEDFKTDILFYQLPWDLHGDQNLFKASKVTLPCYVPYCFYSLKSHFNYFTWFHGMMWKYFVETDFHKKEYMKDYNAKNCVALGSVKFDNYRNINLEQAQRQWKSKDKIKIIYAPHHSIEASDFHNMATFVQNGDFILELAKKYKDKAEWIFRPHFTLKDRLVKHGVKTTNEVEEYYRQWEELGKISKSEDNYYEQFVTSDCLITDCISFLSEYLPVNKPVLHLRNKHQAQPFNNLVQNIIEGYYQIYDNEELERVFNEVLINGNDYLKETRSEKIKYLMIDKDKTTARKIREYLENQLGIK